MAMGTPYEIDTRGRTLFIEDGKVCLGRSGFPSSGLDHCANRAIPEQSFAEMLLRVIGEMRKNHGPMKRDQARLLMNR